MTKIQKVFDKESRAITVLKEINLAIPQGMSLAVLGVSGSGKSTLLNILGILMHPSSGKVFFDGVDVFAQGERTLSAMRNTKIGFVFQSFNLLPEFSCLENIMLPALIANKSRAQAEASAKNLLAEMGLSDREHHRPGEISGGEAQRIAIARALVMEPPLIIADEPTGNLDRESGERIVDILVSLTVSRKASVIVATHNIELAKKMDRKVTLFEGRILESD